MLKINPATLEHRARESVHRTVYDINIVHGCGHVHTLSFIWGKDHGIAYRTMQHGHDCNKIKVVFLGHQRTVTL